MSRVPAFLAVSLLGLVAADASASGRPNFNDSLTARSPIPAPAPTGIVFGRDPGRGVPSLMVIPQAAPAPAHLDRVAAARHYLYRHRQAYKAPRGSVAGARHLFTHDTGRGAIIIGFRQTVAGVDVFQGDVKVMMRRSGELVGIGGSLHPSAVPGGAQTFTLDKTEAIELALHDLYGAKAADARLVPRRPRGGWDVFVLEDHPSLRFVEPARVKKVYFPLADRLVPAYFVEVQAKRGSSAEIDGYQHVVSAIDGKVLYRRDIVEYDAYKYRVWADADGDFRPKDGPTVDFTPHPTGVPGEGPNGYTQPVLITMEGFNTNPDNKSDPWLPPLATETVGNNVDAYVDHNDPDGLEVDDNEFRANLTGAKTFDRVYDVTKEPLANQTQMKAAITQLFYVTNWLHDYWYDSGFDEDNFVAQQDNFGRGGVEGDRMKAEAQDGALKGSRNNANMSTPADGSQPRMQMFLWSSVYQKGTLDVQPMNKSFTVGMAGFGPKNYDITGDVVLYNDGVGPNVNDGCQPAMNNLAGKIALADRGNCTFETKSNNAQKAGAIGVLLVNNVDSAVPLSPGNDNGMVDPTIPTQGMFKPDGAALKAALMNSPQSAHMTGVTGVERDGTIDNMIIAHEWGHYFHHRLQDCGTKQCGGMSEGWGDFTALHMSLREGDNLNGTYASTTYANFDNSGYFGIRRVPYSVDMTKNSLTFRHIQKDEPLPMNHPMAGGPADNSEVHNSGEIWATMLLEAYVALHKLYDGKISFDEVRRLWADHIVAGLLMSPPDATYTLTRDSILIATYANNPQDLNTMALAFAKRGAGTCAVSPPAESTDFKGVVEDYDIQANASLLSLSVNDDVVSCDHDGSIDKNEVGGIHVELINSGVTTLPAGAKLEVFEPDSGLVFPDGSSVDLPELHPLEKLSVTIKATIDESLPDYKPIAVKVRLSTPEGCQEFVELATPAMLNGDVQEDAKTVDDVETTKFPWDRGGAEAEEIWVRQAVGIGYQWHGDDVPRTSDSWLASPTLKVSKDEPLVITFDHAYSFEYSDNINWDGGLIEVSSDDGMTWKDAKDFGVLTYPGKIASDLNPLNKRDAFVHESADFPTLKPLSLDFGTQFSGMDFKIRFRIGTDSAAGGAGWYIDNIDASGITNKPFAGWVVDQGLCNLGESSSGSGSGSGTDTGGSSTTEGLSTGGSSVGTTAADTTGATSITTDNSTDPTMGGTHGGTHGGTGTSGGGSSGGPGPGPGSASESGSEGDSDSDSGSQTPVDDGCGCAAPSDARGGWLLLPLGLLGLRRRRR